MTPKTPNCPGAAEGLAEKLDRFYTLAKMEQQGLKPSRRRIVALIRRVCFDLTVCRHPRRVGGS